MRLKMFFLVIFISITAQMASAQVVVIISAKSAISKVTPEQIAQIFLGQSKTFYNGGMAVPVDLGETKERNEFYQKITGKGSAQVKAYWSKMLFSGNAQPPEVLSDSKSVVKKVAENPKYIGYVDKSAVDATVKVVFAL